MVQSLGQSELFFVNDSFEIKDEHETGHAAGLVVVLDRRATACNALSGTVAEIRLPNGSTINLTIDETKDHLAATSLFFKGLSAKDVPIQSQIKVTSR